MHKITGKELIELGLTPGPRFREAIEAGNASLRSGKSWEETQQILKSTYFKPEPEKLKLKNPAHSIPIACKAENEEERENTSASLQKMRELSQIPVVENLALMPDNCPSGQEWGSIPVGGAITTSNAILPAAHSADIFCSMCATFFKSREPMGQLMGALQKSTHFGPYPAPIGQEKHDPILEEPVWGNPFLKGLEEIALRYLGTQGDGNHFAYIGEIPITRPLLKNLETQGQYELCAQLLLHKEQTLRVLITHHGSRNLGARLYKKGMEAAVEETAKIAENIPKTGAWLDLETPIGKDYWEALQYVGRWTKTNHKIIHATFLSAIQNRPIAQIGNDHNAVWKHDGKIYHGKGATPAWKQEGIPQLGIIPLNMGREILLVTGLDNPQFLSFAPHGAGRNRSRSATIKPFLDPKTGKVDAALVEKALADATEGLHIAWASGKPDISESPLGYKPASKIKRELEEFGLATLIGEIQPKGCIMAGDIEPLWKKKKREKEQKIAAPEIN